MQIEINELTAFISSLVICSKSSGEAKCNRPMGQNIVVLDRGFVYVGDVTLEGDWLKITNAKNIRYWGTKNGLGELRNGPLPEIKLDEVGEVLAPMRAVIHLVPCKGL